MTNAINYKIWTVCMIQDGDRILLLDRQHDHFTGFIPPGGKVEFPESMMESAIREVKEETGLEVDHLIYKGLYEYVNPVTKDRYMIFNYLTHHFQGDLLKDSPEGQAVWVEIEEAYNLPMQPSIRRSFPYFFEEGHSKFTLNGIRRQIKKGKLLLAGQNKI